MPAKSKVHQKAAGTAPAAKTSDKDTSAATRKAAPSTPEKKLGAMASTKRKGKPDHAGKSS